MLIIEDILKDSGDLDVRFSAIPTRSKRDEIFGPRFDCYRCGHHYQENICTQMLQNEIDLGMTAQIFK